MTTKQAYERLSWEDRFNQPDVKNLRGGLPAASRTLFDRVRRRLLDLDGVEERFAWYGDSWKWTVTYSTRHDPDPLAVLIPCPTDLQLAVPLDRDFARSLPVKRMKRAVRDGLELAQDPFDTRWGVWSVPAMSMADDLQALIEQKLKHLVKVAS